MKDYLIKNQQKYYGQTIENTKVLVHRGKKELRKILIKKGFNSMNKLVKILLIVISATILLTGLTYAGRKMYGKVKEKATMTPIFTCSDKCRLLFCPES